MSLCPSKQGRQQCKSSPFDLWIMKTYFSRFERHKLSSQMPNAWKVWYFQWLNGQFSKSYRDKRAWMGSWISPGRTKKTTQFHQENRTKQWWDFLDSTNVFEVMLFQNIQNINEWLNFFQGCRLSSSNQLPNKCSDICLRCPTCSIPFRANPLIWITPSSFKDTSGSVRCPWGIQ
jgi:hypothetical protein